MNIKRYTTKPLVREDGSFVSGLRQTPDGELIFLEDVISVIPKNDPRLFSEQLKEFREQPSVKKLIRKVKKNLRYYEKMNDIEEAHVNADDELKELLSVLGFDDILKEYDKIKKYYA